MQYLVRRFSCSSLLFALLLLVSLPAAAQDDMGDEAADDDQPLLRGSNRALSFSFDALSLRGIDAGVGGKFWLSPSTALRMTFNFRVDSDEIVTEDIADDAIDDGLSAVAGGLGFVVEWHSAHLGRVSPYLGTGFVVGGNASSRTTSFGPTSEQIRRRVKTNGLDFGISAGLGVEWQVTRRVSIAGAHEFLAEVTLGTVERIESFRTSPETVVSSDTRDFTFRSGTSSLILSIYF